MSKVLLAIGTVFLMVACAGDPLASDGDCVTNDECIGGEVCLQGFCTPVCNSDLQCRVFHQHHGWFLPGALYQIGEVQARSCMVFGTSGSEQLSGCSDTGSSLH